MWIDIPLNYDSLTILSNQQLLIDVFVTEQTSGKLTGIDFILRRQFIYAGQARGKSMFAICMQNRRVVSASGDTVASPGGNVREYEFYK